MDEKKGFPNKEQMPVVEKSLRSLLQHIGGDVEALSEICDLGDLQIFLYLMTSIFINFTRDSIEVCRKKFNDSNAESLKVYKLCIDDFVQGVTEQIIFDTILYPPEDWINKTIKA